MLKKSKIAFALAALFISHFASADQQIMNLKMSFVDKLPRSGNVFTEMGGRTKHGPVIERNGGTVSWSHLARNSNSQLMGIEFASGWGFYCLGDTGNVVLNMAKYTGDVITVSLDNIGDDGLNCSCTGSACDVSASKQKAFYPSADASKVVDYKLTFVNQTAAPGSAFTEGSRTIVGPTVPANGGTANWSHWANDQWQLVGLKESDVSWYCLQDAGNLVLNKANYKGDATTITYTQLSDDGLYCSCNGSACDVSQTPPKRKVVIAN